MSNTYTIKEVLKSGNPLDDGTNFKCIKCNNKGEMTYQALPSKYSKYGFDYSCGWCGEWQIEEEKCK
jgi:hypothetical protein|tara:strand:+ start:1570 stop:1770 length:201 start_codon:yes stop_codon:yes gene_type:complete